ncbi:MAG: histidine phosphatase family protein [Eubacteriales bacterium]|nr:histidine phosphatase family protein [Eubacteriales bacterium]
MRIWIVRHGQTELNKEGRVQGRSNYPLNERGVEQARAARASIGDMTFDAVYSSPLDRAAKTAEIIGNVGEHELVKDDRLIETDFGIYEERKWSASPRLFLYWAAPFIVPKPSSVESVKSMVERSRDFLTELEDMDYDDVLVACHGGIIRALRGYLEDRPSGTNWYDRAHNCEIRVYESSGGKHRDVTSEFVHR